MSLADLLHPAGDALAQMMATGRRHRRSWIAPGRVHVEVRGGGSASEALGAHLERSLLDRQGVDHAELDPATGRVAVVFDPGQVTESEIMGLIEAVEDCHGTSKEPFTTDQPDHPGDREPLYRNLVALGADTIGLGLSAVGLVVRLAPVPVEVASLISAVDSSPRLRRVIDRTLGPAGDLGLAVVNGLAQGLSRGPLGLVVDLSHRAGSLAEVAARNRAWDRTEPELVGRAAVTSGDPASVASREMGWASSSDRSGRPVPLPKGWAESYSERAPLAALSAFALSAATVGLGRRAAAVLMAGAPKGARLGPEAFAAQVGRSLADRGTIVMDPSVLRRLDRIDTVVLDASVLTTGASVLGPLYALGGRSLSQLDRRAQALFNSSQPEARTGGEWSLGPLADLGVAVPAEARTAMATWRARPDTVLGLLRGGDLVGVAGVVAELDPLAGVLVGAGRQAGLEVIVAGGAPDLAYRLGAAYSLPGGSRLARSIRQLQAEGRVVALVGPGPAGALLAADCAIGLLEDGRRPPWAADLMVGPGPGAAAVVLEACRPARQVSTISVALAVAGSGLGGAMALWAPPFSAGRRAMLGVNGAALAAVANGAWAGLGVARRPTPVAVSPVAWHGLQAGEVLEALGTTRQGLSEREAARRRRDTSGEVAAGLSPSSLPAALVEELANPLTPLLGAGAALSAAVGSVADAVLVGGVTGLNAAVGAVQRVRTERSLEALVESSSAAFTVVREGQRRDVSVDELVAGDIIHLGAGEVVPADCRILETDSLEVDESALTGESLPVTKDIAACPGAAVADRRCMIFDDTTVAAGSVLAVVVAVGGQTEAGRALAGASKAPPSGVEVRLRDLTRAAVPVTLASGALTTAIGLARGRNLRTALRSGVSLTVAAVPEGLPLLATLAQSASARRLSSHNALVRNPRAIEALGRVDLLCFDKTGTLTEGRLALQRVSDGSLVQDLADAGPSHRLVLAAGLRATPGADGGFFAHATDRAVADGAARAGVARSLGAAGWTEQDELPFASERGFHAVVGTVTGGGKGGQGRRLAVKGAPEVVLPRCSSWARPGGSLILGAVEAGILDAHVDDLARRGLRVLAVAEGHGPASELEDAGVADLELMGFLALADPVRPSAAAAIRGLRRAGVEVAMITGDHASTAEAIAAELGILNGGAVLTGADLDRMEGDALVKALGSASVFARVTPAHKVGIVEGLQRSGRVVAMTGDGANDAAAIRLAHVGIAVGQRRGAAAREAADVVVTDDRIETIVQAIVEGRAMWASVRDALAILIGGNLGEVAFTLGVTGLTGRAPLDTRQLLLVNLLTDLAPALAIALRPPSRTTPEQLLNEGPEASLGRALETQIALRAATTALGASGGWLAARLTGRASRARTVGLVALVGTQLGQTVVAGGSSPVVLITSAASAGVLAAIVQTPVVSQFFGCTPLGPLGWATGAGAAALATAGSLALPRIATRLVPTLPSADGQAL